MYTIDDGLCTKTDAEGNRVDVFKVWTMKSVPDEVTTWEQVHELPYGFPEVGKRLYIGGKDVFWISTKIISIE